MSVNNQLVNDETELTNPCSCLLLHHCHVQSQGMQMGDGIEWMPMESATLHYNVHNWEQRTILGAHWQHHDKM